MWTSDTSSLIRKRVVMESMDEDESLVKTGPVSLFEFLLDDSLLDKHLSQENPDPSAVQLIFQFIQHTETATESSSTNQNNVKIIPVDEVSVEEIDSTQRKSTENKKITVLKVLTLKAAASLKWDLELLERNLPINMVYSILWQFVQTSCQENTEVDLSDLPQHTVFALQLFHRWCLHSIIKDSFLEKPTKTSNITVPGLTDPALIAPLNGGKETVINILEGQVEESVRVLNALSERKEDIIMPALESFCSRRNDAKAEHSWEKGMIISNTEFLAQLSYDLGSYYFYTEDYHKALSCFEKCEMNKSQLKSSSVYCHVDESRLKGYCMACQALTNQRPGNFATSLYQKLEESRKNHYKNVLELLDRDNVTLELPLAYRISVEEEMNRQRNPLYFKVNCYNYIRQAMEAKSMCSNTFPNMLTQNIEDNSIRFFSQVLGEVLERCTATHRNNLRLSIRYLCLTLDDGILDEFKRTVVSKHFTPQEIDLTEMTTTQPDDERLVSPSIGEDVDLEIQVILSNDPSTLRMLLVKLCQHMDYHQLVRISDKWSIPKEIKYSLDSLPRVLDKTLTYILVAKARSCMLLQDYERAQNLLSAADGLIKDISYKLSKYIRWESLLFDLKRYHTVEGEVNQTEIQEITKKVKTCITSLRLESDIFPRAEIIGECVSFLLNTQDWDHLCSLVQSKSGIIEFARLLSEVCSTLPNIANTRKAARDMWEAVLQILSIQTQHKRTGTGSTNTMHRESQLGLLTQTGFIQILERLRNPVLLDTMISCLTKLYNLVKDDVTVQISSAFMFLWPTALSSSGSISAASVTQVMNTVLQEALRVHPNQPYWLKTQADVYFGNNEYTPAMKYYMQAGIASSNYFTDDNPTVFDNQVYRHMIKCCSYLQCHTQVALLCLLLDEADYTTAFKSLQERHSVDTMDSYYPCIWDLSILEYLTHMHTKRGELDKRQIVVQLIGQLDLNSSNHVDSIKTAITLRKQKFLRNLAKQYIK